MEEDEAQPVSSFFSFDFSSHAKGDILQLDANALDQLVAGLRSQDWQQQLESTIQFRNLNIGTAH